MAEQIVIISSEKFQEFQEKVFSSLESIKSSVESDNTNKKRWIRSSEVKKTLGISHGKLQQMRDSNLLIYTKIGRVIFYDIADIEAMMKKGKKA